MHPLPSAQLTRLISTPHGTPGLFTITDGHTLLSFASLELPWKQNMRDKSCIPACNYTCPYLPDQPEHSWSIPDVTNRSAIQLHPFNLAGDSRLSYKTDSRGCIALGMKFTELNRQLALQNSRLAHSRLFDIIGPFPFHLSIAWTSHPIPNYLPTRL